MARRVFLHIGTMKSATSYLQELCELNRGHLAESGVLWPARHLRYRAIRDFFGRTVKEVDFTGAWAELSAELIEHAGDAILSNELLAAANVRQVNRLVKALSPAEVQVVITARDLARVLPSHWQTTLKNGREHTWVEFASAVCSDPVAGEPAAVATSEWFWQRHDLPQIIARWRTAVPAERISVVTVPPSGSDRETVARRFGAVAGVQLTGLVQPETWVNSSLGAHSAELMRRLNQQLGGLDDANRTYGFKGALGESLVAEGAEVEPTFGLSQEQLGWARRRAQTMIAEIALCQVRVEGDLTDLIPDAAATPGAVDPADASDTELLAAASRGLIGMVKAVTALQVQLELSSRS